MSDGVSKISYWIWTVYQNNYVKEKKSRVPNKPQESATSHLNMEKWCTQIYNTSVEEKPTVSDTTN